MLLRLRLSLKMTNLPIGPTELDNKYQEKKNEIWI